MIGPQTGMLELPLLVMSSAFFFLFCLKLGVGGSVFAVGSPSTKRGGFCGACSEIELFGFWGVLYILAVDVC